MPNEQTSVPLFASGEVLTAANMNISAGTGVPVFANTTTRDAGFGGTGEKVLAEGQLCYLSSTNVVQYYDGAAWATVGPAAAPTSGLTFISATSFSAVNSVSLATNSLTSTYQNYSLVVTLSAASATGNLRLRYRAAGADYTGATYYHGGFVATTGGTVANDGMSGATQTYHHIGYYGALDYIMGQITLFNPQGTGNTRFTSSFAGVDSGASAEASNWTGGAVLQNTQYDSITLFCSGATTITGNARLYGYQNS